MDKLEAKLRILEIAANKLASRGPDEIIIGARKLEEYVFKVDERETSVKPKREMRKKSG